MIQEIKDAFKRNLPLLEWMDDATRNAAIEKANAVIDKIGFPKYILNQTALDERYEKVRWIRHRAVTVETAWSLRLLSLNILGLRTCNPVPIDANVATSITLVAGQRVDSVSVGCEGG